MRLILSALVAALTLVAGSVTANTVDWVVGSVTFTAGGSGAPRPVTRGMTLPANAVVVAAAGARVKIDHANGGSTTVNAGQTVNLASARSATSTNLTARMGTGSAASRVGAVAGVRANNQAEANDAGNPLLGLSVESAVPGEEEAIATAQRDLDADNVMGAIAVLDAFVSSNETAWSARIQLAYLLSSADRHADAIPHYAAVVTATPSGVVMTDAYWNYMVSLQAVGQHEESSRVAREAISRYPGSGNAGRWHLVIAQNAIAMGNEEAARISLDAAATEAMKEIRAITQGAASTQPLRETVFASETMSSVFDEQERILDERRALLAQLDAN